MSVRLITFHTPKNYGAVLQALSLSKYLETIAEDVRIIDYNTAHLRSLYPVISKPDSLKGMVKTILMLPTFSEKKHKHQKFSQFVSENLPMGKQYDSTDSLYEEKWNENVFVTGSDQVFNPRRIQEERQAFYLDFVPEGAKRISYAASFGVSEIPEDKILEIQQYLKKFNAISVREQSGVEIVNHMLNYEPQLVLDPVFLNGAAFWREYAKPYPRQLEHYLFYYRLLDDRKNDQWICQLAKKKNLKLVVMTDDMLRFRADVVMRDVGPQEFLYLMDHADLVVTNAFHGVAFSLILQKQFLFSDNSALTNDRGLSLLKRYGIEKEAYIESYTDTSLIRYDDVQKKLDLDIEKSKAFLRDNLKEDKSDG